MKHGLHGHLGWGHPRVGRLQQSSFISPIRLIGVHNLLLLGISLQLSRASWVQPILLWGGLKLSGLLCPCLSPAHVQIPWDVLGIRVPHLGVCQVLCGGLLRVLLLLLLPNLLGTRLQGLWLGGRLQEGGVSGSHGVLTGIVLHGQQRGLVLCGRIFLGACPGPCGRDWCWHRRLAGQRP